MRILIVGKYPPIQGGVSVDTYWTAQALSELGHHVSVLTNAHEVEDSYRLRLTSEDEILLTGYRKKDSIIVRSTSLDRRHLYVPAGNPSISKLVSVGLEMINDRRPDVIWTHYLEPYGVAAMMLSLMTGIPYVVRHAGSDLGRLLPTPQLKTVYSEVFRRSLLILSREDHFPLFMEIGVDLEKIKRPATLRLPGDLFFNDGSAPPNSGPTVLGVYGKTGIAKSTPALIGAMSILRERGAPIVLHAIWGGRDFATAEQLIRSHGRLGGSSAQNVQVAPFIPHWRIPDFIRSCHGILFLEHQFKITFHTPGVPLEVNACGRKIVITNEIASKKHVAPLLRSDDNAFIVPSEAGRELQPELLADSLMIFAEDVRKNPVLSQELSVDASMYSARSRIRLVEILAEIKSRL